MTNLIDAVPASPTCYHGEGPLWDSERETLYWVDLFAGALHALTCDGTHTTRTFEREVTAVAVRADGGLLVADRQEIRSLEPNPRTLASPLRTDPTKRLNDGKCDPVGRFLVGSMSVDPQRSGGALYSLDLDGELRTLVTNVGLANGLDWSPDGATLYFTDSLAKAITAYPYDLETGEIGPGSVIIDLSGSVGEPDGMTVDADGNLWIAVWDAWSVRCFSPAGQLIRDLPTPVQRPTSVAFGGVGLDELYITTSRFELTERQLEDQPDAGRLLLARPGVIGRVANVCHVDIARTETMRLHDQNEGGADDAHHRY